MSKFLHRKAGNCADLISSAFEMQSGFLGIAWGTAVLMPSDLFANDLVYAWFANRAPEGVWGAFVLIAGLCQFSAALCRMTAPTFSVKTISILRAISTAVMTWAFLMMASSFLLGTYKAISITGWNAMSFRLMGACGYPLFVFENFTSLLWLSKLTKGGGNWTA